MNSLPPTFNTSIFNTNAFSSGGYLTKSQADLLYMPYSSVSYLGYLYGVTPGTVTASKAVIVDANKDISSFRYLTSQLLTATSQIKLTNTSTTIFDELAAASLSGVCLADLSGTTGELNTNAISFFNSTSSISSTPPNASITMIKTATGDSQGHLVFHTKSGLLNTSRCNERMRIQADGLIGVNTFLANKQLSINHSTGACLRLIRNNTAGSETLYSDLSIDASGNLVLTSSGGYIDLQALKLNGSIVTSTATELNYNDITTIGTAQASKSLVTDSNIDISSIRRLHCANISIGTSDFSLTSRLLVMVDSTLIAGGARYLTLGKSHSTYNNAEWGYYHVGDGNSLNRCEFGFYGANGIFAVVANRRVGINTTTPTVELDVSGAISLTGILTSSLITDATSTTAAANIMSGGLAVAKNIFTAGLTTTSTINNSIGCNSSLASNLAVNSLIGLYDIYLRKATSGLNDTCGIGFGISTNSIATTTPGAGIIYYRTSAAAGALTLNTSQTERFRIDENGLITTSYTLDSSSISTGSLVLQGGLGVAKTITCTTLNTTTLGLTTLNVSGILTSTNTTASTAYTNGAIITAGGIGVAKASYFNSNVSMGTSSGGIMVGTSTDNTRLLSCLQSGLATSSSNYITHGVANTSNNQVEHSFYYAGSGSTSNLYEIGFYGGSRLFSLSALGRLNINNSGSLGSAVCQVQIQSAGYSLGLVYSTTYFTRMATIGDGRFALEVNTAGGSGGSTTAYFEYLSSGAMNLGLGLTPRFRLDLGNTANDFMICLYNLNNLSPTFGIGANDSAMMYHSAGSNGHRWYINTTGGVGAPNTVGTKYMELTSAGLNIPSGAITSTINTYSTKHFSGTGVELNSIVNGNTDGGYGTYSNHPFNIRTNNTNRIQISATGNVGIGLSATYLLDVSHTSQNLTGGYAYYTSSDTSGTGSSTGNQNFSARFSGRIAVAGEVDVYSDKRIKSNIKDLDEEYVDKFMNLKAKSYVKKTTNRKEIGFIAQDVVKLGLDELYMLHHTEIDEEVEDDGFLNPKDRIFTLNYNEMIPILFKKIQMMDKKIKDLEKNI